MVYANIVSDLHNSAAITPTISSPKLSILEIIEIN